MWGKMTWSKIDRAAAELNGPPCAADTLVATCIYGTHSTIKSITFNIMFVRKQATHPSAFPSAVIVVLVLENSFTPLVFFPPLTGCQAASLTGLPANPYFLKGFMPGGQVYVLK